jgi:hypothetical protein
MKSIMTLRVKRLAAVALAGVLAHTAIVSSASAASASGPSALALAAVVASHGSLLGSFDKRAMIRLFDGKSLIIPRVNKIVVAADSIVCKMSDVDITARSCDLVFKSHKRTITGRDANEVYGTLAIAGVASEGAAGSITESMMKLECTIDPMVIKQKAGGGADCTFETGQ